VLESPCRGEAVPFVPSLRDFFSPLAQVCLLDSLGLERAAAGEGKNAGVWAGGRLGSAGEQRLPGSGREEGKRDRGAHPVGLYSKAAIK